MVVLKQNFDAFQRIHLATPSCSMGGGKLSVLLFSSVDTSRLAIRKREERDHRLSPFIVRFSSESKSNPAM